MGYRHSRDDILGSAVQVALADGLHALSFGRVAKHVGASDRIVVYYFPTKSDLVGAVLAVLGERLMTTLSSGLTGRFDHHLELLRVTWPLVANDDADPVFALFFEALGLAASGSEPYHSLVPFLVTAWLDWMSGMFTGTPARRRAQAEAAIAVIDGLLLLRQVGGATAADRAVGTLLA